MQTYKFWLFTCFDIKDDNERYTPESDYEIYQIEQCPDTGRLHAQGFVMFGRARNLLQMRRLLPKAHWEFAKGSAAQCKAYCTKDNTRVRGPYEFMEKQTKLRPLEAIGKQIISGKPLAEIAEESPDIYIRSYRGMQSLAALKYTQRTTKPFVKWIYGPTGVGKTRSVVDYCLLKDLKFYMKNPSNKWWDGYSQEHVVILDDVRGDAMKFHEWLRLLDWYPLLLEFKGGSCHFNSPEIYITAPFHPSELFSGRDDIEQLLRRIDVIEKYE